MGVSLKDGEIYAGDASSKFVVNKSFFRDSAARLNMHYLFDYIRKLRVFLSPARKFCNRSRPCLRSSFAAKIL